MATVFDPLRLGAVALDVMAASQGTAASLLARQQTRLQNVVATAVRSSAYYRAVWQDKIKGNWQLSDLPVVQKKDLMAHFDEWVTDPALRLETIRAFWLTPAGLPNLCWVSIWYGRAPARATSPVFLCKMPRAWLCMTH